MLIDVEDDRLIQAYLDRTEQRLHYHQFPLICAGIRLQMARGSIAAQHYIQQRGEPMLRRHYRQVYSDIYTASYHQKEEKAARTGLSQFLTDQLAYMERRAGRRIADISHALVEQIREIVMRGVRNGESNQTIAARIYRDIPEISRGRAARISRTETHNAAMAAGWEAMKARRPPVVSKTWWTASDERVRESHAALHGVTIPVDEPFEAESGPMMYPSDQSLGAGAEDVVNCRCTPLYHTS